jgi:hypothetical protein
VKKKAKKENELMRDLFSRQEVFEPSSSFTDRVMYRVSVEKSYYGEIYKPLISRTAWIIIAVSVAALIVLAIVLGGEGTTYTRFLPDVNFNPDLNLSWISSITDRIYQIFHNTSPVTMYVIFSLLGVCLVLITESLLPRRIFGKR